MFKKYGLVCNFFCKFCAKLKMCPKLAVLQYIGTLGTGNGLALSQLLWHTSTISILRLVWYSPTASFSRLMWYNPTAYLYISTASFSRLLGWSDFAFFWEKQKLSGTDCLQMSCKVENVSEVGISTVGIITYINLMLAL